jgi:hypothetical protein
VRRGGPCLDRKLLWSPGQDLEGEEGTMGERYATGVLVQRVEMVLSLGVGVEA